VTPSSGFPTDRQLSPAADRRTINLGRSVLGASGTLWTRWFPVKNQTDEIPRNLRQLRSMSLTKSDRRLVVRGVSDDPKRNAPSRWRPRPASRLTFAEAIACRGAINLGRSVLGAVTTLGGRASHVKAVSSELFANCAVFFSHRSDCDQPCVLWLFERQEKGRTQAPGRKRFAEPGTLSSTFPTNLPLPRSAPRGASSYRRPVLGAGRNLRKATCPIKGCLNELLANCVRVLSRSRPARSRTHGASPVAPARGGARPADEARVS